MQTEITLTDRQQEILIIAAIDHNGHLEPAAASINIRGGAFTNMMHTLRNAGLVEGEDAETRLTPAGYAAISVDAHAPAEQDVQENSERADTQEPDSATETEAAPETEQASATSELEATPEPEPEMPTKKPRKLRSGTKQATIIEMLQREEGASLQQLMEATGWQMHTTRAVLSRTIQKDLGIPLTSEKTSGGDRIYRIA